MRKTNKAWMAAVAAALLLGTLVGVVWAWPNHGPAAQTTTRKVTLAGADFLPLSESCGYAWEGGLVYCVSGSCEFTAPILFPTLGSVTVERIKLHVIDGNGLQDAAVTLYRAKPSAGSFNNWGGAASAGSPSASLQTYSSSDINNVVWPSQRAYLYLQIGGMNILVYGVTVEYHVGS